MELVTGYKLNENLKIKKLFVLMFDIKMIDLSTA